MKKILKLIAVAPMAAAAVSCGSGNGIEGAWTEPVPGMPGMTQGILLEDGGKASSINMATLKYDRWEKDGDLLILHGESIGNRQTISFADTMRIEKVSQDSLILRKGQRVTRYAKADVIPAEKLVPAKKAMTVKGELVIGHEVRSFKAEGDTAACWVVDKSGDLIKKYDEVTGGTKNGTPVYVEMEVIDEGHSDEGFAAGYATVYNVTKVNSISHK